MSILKKNDVAYNTKNVHRSNLKYSNCEFGRDQTNSNISVPRVPEDACKRFNFRCLGY